MTSPVEIYIHVHVSIIKTKFYILTIFWPFHSAPVHLLSTWSHGTPMCSSFWTVRRTRERRSSEPGTCSTRCGSQTSSCGEWRPTRNGPWWTRTNVQDFTTAGGRNLRSCMRSKCWGVGRSLEGGGGATRSGPWWTRTNVQDFMTAGERNLRNYMRSKCWVGGEGSGREELGVDPDGPTRMSRATWLLGRGIWEAVWEVSVLGGEWGGGN